MKAPAMNERRFDLLLTLVLLLFGLWYVKTMSEYPSNAGRVPSIVAAVFLGAVVVQLLGSLRGLRRTVGVDAGAAAKGAVARAATSQDEPHEHAGPPPSDPDIELDQSGYDQFIALGPVRRKRFLTIAGYSIAYYLGMQAVGFVVSTGILFTALLLIVRERFHVAITAGLIGAAAVYALVVWVLDMPVLSGYLVG